MFERRWLSVPSARKLRDPGLILTWIGRCVLAKQRTIERPKATDDAYFTWEAASATDAWDYYRRVLPIGGKPLKVLDVGSGPGGRTVSYAAQSDARFFCLDRSEELQLSAMRHIPSMAPGQVFPIVGNAYGLPFSDEAFDLCLCENSLEHFDHPELAVQEMQRVLKSGGHLVALFPPWRGAYAGHLLRLTWLPWIHLLPKRTVTTLLAAIHFARDHNDGATWRDNTVSTVHGLANSLNGWGTREILAAFRDTGRLELADAYVLGEWSVGRLLRFVPWLGEFFSSAVYLIFKKCEAPSRHAYSFTDLQQLTRPRPRKGNTRVDRPSPWRQY